MKEKLNNLYNQLLDTYKIGKTVKLLVLSYDEYKNSDELKKELQLYPEKILDDFIDTPAYYSTESETIYIIYDYFDRLNNSFINKISPEIIYYFAIMHEFRHIIQRSEENSFENSIRLMEMSIYNYYDNYNMETHDDWFCEIDANLFAAKELKKIINNYSGIDYDYILLMNYLYQYQYDNYDFNKLTKDYLNLPKDKRLKNNYMEQLFDEDGYFKSGKVIQDEKNKIDYNKIVDLAKKIGISINICKNKH